MARRFRRVRHYARSHAGTATNSLISVGTGGAIGVAAGFGAKALRGVPWIGTAWWALPLATGLAGHFLKGNHPTVGGALLGISGFWAANSVMSLTGNLAMSQAPAQGFIDAGFTAGDFIDAGRYAVGGSDCGALNYNDNGGTDAAPALGTAQAAMLFASSNAMGLESESGDLVEAYGLVD
jgi:hypothetical protein